MFGFNVSPTHSGNKALYNELLTLAANENNQLQIAEQNVKEKPSVDGYISLSLMYYQKHQYEKCIEASTEALKLDVKCVAAYNNICSA